MGKYVTEEFEPAFYFKLGEGWQAIIPESADGLFLKHGAETEFLYDMEALHFTTAPYVYNPSDPSARLPAPENTAEWVSWFQRHPNLDTSEPVPVTVGGESGLAIEVTDINTPETYRERYQQFCGKRPCVPLLSTSYGNWIGPFSGTKYRFVIVDVGGETVVGVIGAPADNFSEYLPKAQRVLDTVEWQE